jgi:hypothetical protein
MARDSCVNSKALKWFEKGHLNPGAGAHTRQKPASHDDQLY